MRHCAPIWIAISAALVGIVAGPTRAAETWSSVFRDDFNGTALNPSAWVVEQANGSYAVSGGRLNLSSYPSGFPQIASTPGLIPSGAAIKLRYGFQFGNTTCFGSALGARVPDCIGACGCPPYYSFHRDCAVGTDARFPGTTSCTVAVTSFEGGSPAYHIGELVIYADSVVAVVDGQTVYAAAGRWPPPSALWFGSVGDPCCSYTEFSVDFAEVLVLAQPVPVERRSWGKVKARYR